MAMLTLQVKLSEETIKQIDDLRGPELGWTQSAIARLLIETALKHGFSLPECSLDRTNMAQANQTAATN